MLDDEIEIVLEFTGRGEDAEQEYARLYNLALDTGIWAATDYRDDIDGSLNEAIDGIGTYSWEFRGHPTNGVRFLNAAYSPVTTENGPTTGER
ncbi:MAG: hypothetical protein HY340_03095 [Candidatus Kerfeldbacteria bacterium]|nr:hypothetical protein [Candidatus Kerfeldbacteria bacterium]